MPQVLALLRYWESAPPVHEAVASFLGMLKPIAPPPVAGGVGAAPDEIAASDDAFDNLMKDFTTFIS